MAVSFLRVVLTAALVMGIITGCQTPGTAPPGEAGPDQEQIRAVMETGFQLLLEYKALHDQREEVLDRYQAETTIDRRRLAMAAWVGSRYLKTHPDDGPGAVAAASAWYEDRYSEPIGVLLARLFGDGPEVPSDGDLLLEVIGPYLGEFSG